MHTTVLRNAAVFTGDAARSWASALVIRDGLIAAVGGDAEVAPYLTSADEVIDARGNLVTPGFVDAHLHPIIAGLERNRCDLTDAASVEDCVDRVREYLQSPHSRASEWVLGAGWSMDLFPDGLPRKEILDAVVPDRPVYLSNLDHHSVWVNSKALELAGITRESPDPPGGVITRDGSGEPTGAIHEAARDLFEQLIPPVSDDENAEALRAAQTTLHGYGVTAWQDAMVEDGAMASNHRTYLRAQAEGWLTARVSAALRLGPTLLDIETEVAKHISTREAATREVTSSAAGRYQVTHIKIFVDGIAETFTAAMIDPYCSHDGRGGTNGLTFFAPQVFQQAVVALDAAGFGIHFHAIGDRAVRDALDALEAARRINGTADRRHQLAHVQVVHPQDRQRFRELGAAVNMQSLWACHEPQMDNLTLPFMGPERAQWQYPFGDLYRSGATLVAGSDWPITSPDPWQAIQVAVTRTSPGARATTRPLGHDQQLPLAVALGAYTSGSAWASRLDHVVGTLKPGMAADVVMHDRNPFSRPLEEIHETRVQRTYASGKLVHQSPN